MLRMALRYLIEFRLVTVRTRRRSTTLTPLIRLNKGGHKGRFPNFVLNLLIGIHTSSLYKEILIVVHVTLFRWAAKVALSIPFMNYVVWGFSILIGLL